jgi:hypothetical protein
LEKWTYKRNGAVEGPVGAEQLAALYAAGEITARTLVRSTTAGGGWQPYEKVVDLRRLPGPRRWPPAITKLWPWFIFGLPLLVGAIDVFLIRSQGNGFVAANSWVGHAPIIVNLSAIALWLVLIWRDIKKADRRYGLGEMIIWFVATPVVQALTWWGAALVATMVNSAVAADVAPCGADVVQAQVRAQFERIVRKRDPAARALGLSDIKEQWGGDRLRMCAARVEATTRPYTVRYKVEDKGNLLFRNTLHGLYVTIFVE